MHLNHPQALYPCPPPLVDGKIAFCETGPWYQKHWGPLLQAKNHYNIVKLLGMDSSWKESNTGMISWDKFVFIWLALEMIFLL